MLISGHRQWRSLKTLLANSNLTRNIQGELHLNTRQIEDGQFGDVDILLQRLVLKRRLSTQWRSGLPSQAQIVICGSGAVANSVAYHLVENGWKDVVILEQGSLCSGTSHFGSGTLGLFKPIEERNIILYSIKLYLKLQEMGYDIGLNQCGSLNLAQTKDRMIMLKRRMAYNLPTGLQCEMLGANELKQLHPYLRTEDLEGGVWVPHDAVAKPTAICQALADIAKKQGAIYIEHCQVDEVLTNNGRVAGVVSNLGNISCEYFVNCAGMDVASQLMLRNSC